MFFTRMVNPQTDDVDDIIAKCAPNVVVSISVMSPTNVLLNFSHQISGVSPAPLNSSVKPIIPPHRH